MNIKIGSYENSKINGNGPEFARNCTLRYPNGIGLGGVDHYMKKSIKTLVNYYNRRILREGIARFPAGSYEIVIDLSENFVDISRTIRIPVEITA